MVVGAGDHEAGNVDSTPPATDDHETGNVDSTPSATGVWAATEPARAKAAATRIILAVVLLSGGDEIGIWVGILIQLLWRRTGGFLASYSSWPSG